MKRALTKISSFCIAAMIIIASVTTAFADDSARINEADVTANKGDTLTFTLNLADTTEDVIGFELRITYDETKLEYVKGSLKSETFDTLFFNEDIPGKLPLNWTDFNNPVNCSEKTPFFTCNFNVLEGGDTKICYFVTELYGEDMTYLKSYKWTYDLTDGDTTIVSDGVLPITDDEEILNSRQSQYINYVDGMGEENSPNKDNHQSVVGQRSTIVQNEVVDVTRYEDVENGESVSVGKSSGVSPLVFVLIALPVIAALIVLAIVLSSRKNKKASAINFDNVEEPKFDLGDEMEAMEESGEVYDET